MQTPRELPELPIAFDRLPCEPDDDMIDVFTPTQMHAYARKAIAESEARADYWRRAATAAIQAINFGRDAPIAQEAEREAVSA